jgi:hypothetical protein
MATGNTNYTVTDGGDKAATSAEKRLKKEWEPQITRRIPLLACIKDSKFHFRKGYKVEGNKALVPIVYTGVTALTTSNLGVTDANEIGSAWPTWDATEGFTNAEYQFSHFRRPMTFKNSEEMLAMSAPSLAQRGNVKEGKIQQLMYTFKSLMGDMIEGESNTSSRTKLMGLAYGINTANSPGNIDQSDANNAWWRGNKEAIGGSISLPVIDRHMDNIERYSGYDDAVDSEGNNVDLLMLSYAEGGVNVYGSLRSQIAPAERLNNIEFKAKYGIETYMYRGAKCVQGSRMPSGTVFGISTSAFFYGGDDSPKKIGPSQRILGSDAFEDMYTLWAFIGACRFNTSFQLTGIL